MAKKPSSPAAEAPPPPQPTEAEALGGPMIPLPASVAAAARPRPISLALAPAAAGAMPVPAPPQPFPDGIRRIGLPSAPVQPMLMPASASALARGPAPALPDFLGGLTAGQQEARKSCELLARQMHRTLTDLRANLRLAGELLDAITNNPDGLAMAARDGLQLDLIKLITAKLLAELP